MGKTSVDVKNQFEVEFYLIVKDQLDQYKGARPIITWLNEDKKPMIDMNFLLHVDRHTRIKISILMDKFALQCQPARNESRMKIDDEPNGPNI